MTERAPTQGALAIEALAGRIQRFDPRTRWVYAQQDLIRAKAAQQPIKRGRWSTHMDRFVARADSVGLLRAFVFLVAVSLTLLEFVRHRGTPMAEGPGKMFVGIGALSEPGLIRQYAESTGAEIDVVNETDLRTLADRHRPSFRDLWAAFTASWRETRETLDRVAPDGAFWRAYCATFLALNLHRYSWCRAWFAAFRRARPREAVAFAAASYVAAAAVAAGVRALYLPHGFIARSVVLPEFSEVICSNDPEATHYRARLPRSRVTVVPIGSQNIETTRSAAIAGVYGNDVEFELCRTFIDWARNEGLPVVVRPHPKDTSSFWGEWGEASGVLLDREEISFQAFLSKWRPAILVTWHSTALLDALMHGVVPVTVSPDTAFSDDLVFPFREIALRWPRERALVEALVHERSLLSETIRSRRASVFDGTPVEEKLAS